MEFLQWLGVQLHERLSPPRITGTQLVDPLKLSEHPDNKVPKGENGVLEHNNIYNYNMILLTILPEWVIKILCITIISLLKGL